MFNKYFIPKLLISSLAYMDCLVVCHFLIRNSDITLQVLVRRKKVFKLRRVQPAQRIQGPALLVWRYDYFLDRNSPFIGIFTYLDRMNFSLKIKTPLIRYEDSMVSTSIDPLPIVLQALLNSIQVWLLCHAHFCNRQRFDFA